MDNTTYWLIALTVGLVGFMIYVFITSARMQEDIDLAGMLATTALIDSTEYTEDTLKILIKALKSGDFFTNTNKDIKKFNKKYFKTFLQNKK
jgi:hypothetical protein